jgi:5-methylcytosine-specific restriction endonuclease McrA
MDRFPKKPCKRCGNMGHFTYKCFDQPIKTLKRSRLNPIGKQGQNWIEARSKWLKNNPPPIDDKYWLCYLKIHPWCPVRLDRSTITLDHVVSRTRGVSKRYDQDNLQPACKYCNQQKGSKDLDQVKPVK